jgi:hypothetical protein
MKNILLPAIIILGFSSCFQNFYRIQSNNTWNTAQIDSIKKSGQKIIIHFNNDVKMIPRPEFNAKNITGELVEYKSSYKQNNTPHPLWHNRYSYKRKNRTDLFSERHIYLKDEYSGQQTVTINDSNFLQTQVYLHDKKATRASHILVPLIVTGVFVGGSVYALSNMSVDLY